MIYLKLILRPMGILLAVTLIFAIGVRAQTLHGVTDALSGGGSIIPPTCNGTIDLSTGCVQPMLRGL